MALALHWQRQGANSAGYTESNVEHRWKGKIMQTIEVAQVYVAALSDIQIDALVDRYVVHQDPWCDGSICQGHCTLCGAALTPTMAQQIFGNTGHYRLVPRYTLDRATARLVFDAIARLGETVESCHTLNLSCLCPALVNMQKWLLYKVTARQVAIAALQAVGIV